VTRRKLVLCMRHDGYEVSLERRKIYQVVPDRGAVAHHQLRVVAPASFFAPIALTLALRRAVLAVV